MTGMSRRAPGCERVRTATRPERGPFFAGAVLAVSMAVTGCLVPQSVEPNTVKTHIPPRIQVSSIPAYLLAPSILLYPHGSQDLSSTPSCHCHVELGIPVVEMLDYSQDLQVRWFVDYDPNTAGKNLPRHFETLSGSLEGAVVRPGPTWKVEADALGLSDGLHVFDVVIVEQGGFDDSSTALPNRAVRTDAGYEAATFRFIVNVRQQQDVAQPICPTSAPSVRTCP